MVQMIASLFHFPYPAAVAWVSASSSSMRGPRGCSWYVSLACMAIQSLFEPQTIWMALNLFLFVYNFEFYKGPQYTVVRVIIHVYTVLHLCAITDAPQDGLPVARGAALVLNFNCALLLLPVCRNIVDKARGLFSVSVRIICELLLIALEPPIDPPPLRQEHPLPQVVCLRRLCVFSHPHGRSSIQRRASVRSQRHLPQSAGWNGLIACDDGRQTDTCICRAPSTWPSLRSLDSPAY